MKLVLDIAVTLLLITAVTTARGDEPRSLVANPAMADHLIASFLRHEATYHGKTPQGVACKVVIKKKTWGHGITVIREANEYEPRGMVAFASLNGKAQNTRQYAVTQIYEAVSAAYDDFVIQTRNVKDVAPGAFGITELEKTSTLSVGFLRGKLMSVSVHHAYNDASKRGQYETCGCLSGQFSP